MRVQPEQVEHGAKAIETLMYSLGMTKQRRYWGDPEPVYYASKWVRVDHGGILFSDVALGERRRAARRRDRSDLEPAASHLRADQRPRARHGAQPGRAAGIRCLSHRHRHLEVRRGDPVRRRRRRRHDEDEATPEDDAPPRGRTPWRIVEKLTFVGFLCGRRSRSRWCCSRTTRAATRTHMASAVTPLEAVLGILLLIGWFVFLRATPARSGRSAWCCCSRCSRRSSG